MQEGVPRRRDNDRRIARVPERVLDRSEWIEVAEPRCTEVDSRRKELRLHTLSSSSGEAHRRATGVEKKVQGRDGRGGSQQDEFGFRIGLGELAPRGDEVGAFVNVDQDKQVVCQTSGSCRSVAAGRIAGS